MSTHSTQQMDVDTGQIEDRNVNNMKNNLYQNKDVLNLVENQQINKDSNESSHKGILIEIEYCNQQIPEDKNEIE